MTADASLRRSLRKVPAYRLLEAGKLDALTARMERREFKRGDVLWHGKVPPGFLGVLGSGEAVLERRHRGRIIRSSRLGAGDVFGASVSGKARQDASLAIRALTDGILYILPGFTEPPQVRHASGRRVSTSLCTGIWTMLIVLAILALTRHDLLRILSGAFFLASNRAPAGSVDGGTMQFLEYATWVDPRAAFAYNQEGYLNLQAGDLIEAEADFLRTLHADSGNAPGLNNLAVTYFNLNQREQALEIQRSAVSQNPDRAVVQYNLGEILLERGAEREALRAFREASLIAPEWALPHMQAGCVYLRMLDYVRAEQEAREAIRLNPSQSAAHLTLAIALYHQGRLPEAQTALAQALKINPEQPVGRFYQALTLNALGETDTALALLETLRSEETDPLTVARLETEIEALQRVIHDRAP